MSGVISQNISVASGQITAAATSTESASNPTLTENPEDVGAEWHNTTSGAIFICIDNTADNNVWVNQSSLYLGGSDTGLFLGGYIGSAVVNSIDKITISTLGDTSDFGDLTTARYQFAGTSNGINERGVAGGGTNNLGTNYNTIDYVTINVAGDATDFGDLLGVRIAMGACSNGPSERGLFMGGAPSDNNPDNVIQYITINSTGDATDFGDCTSTTTQGTASLSNSTNDRGVRSGGSPGTPENVMDYVTISSTGNATDFGDMTTGRHSHAACSNGTNERGLWGGGYYNSALNNIGYITISTTGNATDFGDLTGAARLLAGLSNGRNDRGVFGGGRDSSMTDTIAYVTISTTGNATDFGNLTTGANQGLAACDDGV